MYNVVNEPHLVRLYQEEYLRLINYYSNIKRPSIFVKYYSQNLASSPGANIPLSTYDTYTKTENIWDGIFNF